MCSEDDTNKARKRDAVQRSTLLDRARAASKARGYEDTDESEDDVKSRPRRAFHAAGISKCGCPHCKTGAKGDKDGCAFRGRQVGGFGSSARRTLLQVPLTGK